MCANDAEIVIIKTKSRAGRYQFFFPLRASPWPAGLSTTGSCFAFLFSQFLLFLLFFPLEVAKRGLNLGYFFGSALFGLYILQGLGCGGGHGLLL
jgi:hypothetical protein